MPKEYQFRCEGAWQVGKDWKGPQNQGWGNPSCFGGSCPAQGPGRPGEQAIHAMLRSGSGNCQQPGTLDIR